MASPHARHLAEMRASVTEARLVAFEEDHRRWLRETQEFARSFTVDDRVLGRYRMPHDPLRDWLYPTVNDPTRRHLEEMRRSVKEVTRG